MDSPLPTRHKHIRLESTSYALPGAICSVTIAVRLRQPIFADARLANATVEVLRQLIARSGALVYAYCIMPDYVHLVFEPSPTCDIITFVGQFKNLAQRAAWRHGVSGAFWQRSFWDHFLRADEAVERVVSYVLENPVRSGLVRDRRDYAYAGSFVFAID